MQELRRGEQPPGPGPGGVDAKAGEEHVSPIPVPGGSDGPSDRDRPPPWAR